MNERFRFSELLSCEVDELLFALTVQVGAIFPLPCNPDPLAGIQLGEGVDGDGALLFLLLSRGVLVIVTIS